MAIIINSSTISSNNRKINMSRGPFPLALSSNDQIPEFLYKQFPVFCLTVGAVFNIILIYYIIASKKYKSPLFTFITSLSMTDFVSCIGLAGWAGLLYPTIIAPHPGITCKALAFVGNVGLSGSAYHLAFFSCLRYYQLCYPLHARAKVTKEFVLKICVVIWIGSCVAWGILAVFHKAVDVLYNGRQVAPICSFSGDVIIRNWFLLIVNTSIPCGTILIMHVLKHVQLLFQAKQQDLQQGHQNTDARAVVIIIILFFIAWCPANIYALLRTNVPNADTYQDKLYHVLGFILGYNSCINPIVYVLSVKSIRNDIQRFLCFRQKQFRK